jgi:hypothetical protein
VDESADDQDVVDAPARDATDAPRSDASLRVMGVAQRDRDGSVDTGELGEPPTSAPAEGMAAPAAKDGGKPVDASMSGGSARDSGTSRDSGAVRDSAVARDSAASSDSSAPIAADAGVPPVASGACAVPAEAQLEDVSRPTTVVGSGTAASCTSSAFVAAVAKGGVITFNCGSEPVTITLEQTAKVFNDKSQKVVIDGAGKITLSGGGRVRILYQNTCDQSQVWTTAHCDNQEYPQLTVQNLTFVGGSEKGSGQGGGAIYAQGGRLKILNSRFYNNVCSDVGPDVGGGAVRALQQYNGLPAYVVSSTFGEPGRGNACSNGGALSSIGVSYTVLNSRFSSNRAIGNGANPAQAGTPGGGSGGAIYNDGNTFSLNICGSTLESNSANEGGGAIFFVSNDRSGQLLIKDSTLESNPSGKFENYPGMFVLARSAPTFTNSVIR